MPCTTTGPVHALSCPVGEEGVAARPGRGSPRARDPASSAGTRKGAGPAWQPLCVLSCTCAHPQARIGSGAGVVEVVTLGEVGAHSGCRRRAGGVARHTRLPCVGWVVGVGSLWHPLPVGGPDGGLGPGRTRTAHNGQTTRREGQEEQNRKRRKGEEEHGGTLEHAGRVGRPSPHVPSKALKRHASGNR